jgi:hypothetical protein
MTFVFCGASSACARQGWAQDHHLRAPGWPRLIAADYEHDSNRKESQQIRLQMFGNIVEIATQLREGRVTVYSVDPSALGDLDPGVTTPPTNHLRRSESDVGIAGANKPSEVRAGDLGLEVLAIQSGGLALHPATTLLRVCENASPTRPLSTRSPWIP